MAVEALTLSEYMSIANDLTGARAVNFDKALEAVRLQQISPADFEKIVYQSTGRFVSPVYDKAGGVISFNYSDTPTYHRTNPLNSNSYTTARGRMSSPINTTVDSVTGKVRAGKLVPPSGAPSTWSYVANSVASPIIAAGVGISLGKTIDSALYNLNPNFWDSNGMGAINPETWNSLTTGIDYTDPITGTAASLMNMIFGLNPDTGETTAYIDENAYAYMAYWLYQQNAFSNAINNSEGLDIGGFPLISPIPANTVITGVNKNNERSGTRTTIGTMYSRDGFFTPGYIDDSGYTRTCQMIAASEERAGTFTSGEYTYNGLTAYYKIGNFSFDYLGAYKVSTILPPVPTFSTQYSMTDNQRGALSWLLVYGSRGGVAGIGTQPNATLPDVSTWNDLSNVLPSLQQQYPDVFGDPIEQTTVNPDGTTTTRRYVPIPLPNVTGNPDTQPTSGTQTQQDIKADVDTSPEWLTELIAKLIQQPDTDPFTPTPTAPENPIDTGEGESPVPVAPVGSASALWSIYHPTQSQINSFGGWLWSADFIEQLKKIFNNPMESIIGLHKVYATPIDAGTSTIHVGYLDSEIPSAYITQQYITVDCGSVDLLEQFGNVFDYGPFTSVKLYLPFIGIVNLDVSEVMRSTISIKYGVDVITGACLAMVSVSRDGNDSILYQFAGNCAVQYPLSMGSYMGIVSSIIGIAGSIAATVATGGSVAPLAIGAIGGAMNAHTSVQNSGSFSGNAGAMGGKKPYLIIERPQTRLANNQQSYIGTPTNEHKTVGNYSGFVKFRDVHLTGIPATDEELSQIQSYLTSGVII